MLRARSGGWAWMGCLGCKRQMGGPTCWDTKGIVESTCWVLRIINGSASGLVAFHFLCKLRFDIVKSSCVQIIRMQHLFLRALLFLLLAYPRMPLPIRQYLALTLLPRWLKSLNVSRDALLQKMGDFDSWSWNLEAQGRKNAWSKTYWLMTCQKVLDRFIHTASGNWIWLLKI